MTKQELKRLDKAVSTLNNLMEKHYDYFKVAYDCEDKDTLVDEWGFGYFAEDKKPIVRFIEGDGIRRCKYTFERIEKMINRWLGNEKRELEMLLRLQGAL